MLYLCRLYTYGRRAFLAAGPRVCNPRPGDQYKLVSSSALVVLDDNALYKFTYLFTYIHGAAYGTRCLVLCNHS